MCAPPNPFLGATKRIDEIDVPVARVELEHGVYAGVTLTALLSGLVPILEEQEARLERGFSLFSWSELDYWEKVLILAARRVRMAMKNLQSEAEIEDVKRKTHNLR